jgi:hypothetical protein
VDRSKLRNQIHAALDTARCRGHRHPDEADTGDLVDAVMGPVDEWDDVLHDDLKDEIKQFRAKAELASEDSDRIARAAMEIEQMLRSKLRLAREELAEQDTIERKRIAESHLRMAEVDEAYIDVNQRRESAERERDAAMAARDKARAELAALNGKLGERGGTIFELAQENARLREDLESLKRHEWFVGKAAESRAARTVDELTELLVATSAEWDDNTGDDETSRPYLEHLARAVASWRPVPAEAVDSTADLEVLADACDDFLTAYRGPSDALIPDMLDLIRRALSGEDPYVAPSATGDSTADETPWQPKIGERVTAIRRAEGLGDLVTGYYQGTAKFAGESALKVDGKPWVVVHTATLRPASAANDTPGEPTDV